MTDRATGPATGPATVGLDDVVAAAARIAGFVERTPSTPSRTLGELAGCHLVLKHEQLQFTASFKERGACNRLLLLSEEERARGVVAMSAGNHAQAVARHAALLGIDATIVMPATTPFVKVHHTRHHGARVVLAGDDLAGAALEAQRIEAAEGRVFVHPYDDPGVVAGQGTVALELLADHPDLGALVVPVGGGGLIAGMAVAAKALRPDLVVVGVQSDRWPSMRVALGTEPSLPGGVTVADGIAVSTAGAVTVPLVRDHVDLVVAVPDQAVEHAITLLLEVEKVAVEGAGAAGLAALVHADPATRELLEGRRVGLVLSGGNIDPRLLASVIMRGLARSGRLARLMVEVNDAPGALASLATALGVAGANIVELVHDRMLLDVSARSAEIEVVVETFDHAHLERVIAAVGEAGFRVTLADSV